MPYLCSYHVTESDTIVVNLAHILRYALLNRTLMDGRLFDTSCNYSVELDDPRISCCVKYCTCLAPADSTVELKHYF